MKRTLLEQAVATVRDATEGECVEWPGSRSSNGYGSLTRWAGHTGSPVAHRAVYELVVGPIPSGLQLDHLCRNRACVNPAHLEPVTPSENCIRAVAARSEYDVREFCIRGHRRADNTYEKYKSCRRCNAEAVARCKARRRGAR